METFTFALDEPRELISDDEMLDGLRAFAGVVNGRPFKMREFDEWAGRPCRANTIGERFGSWRKALTRAGVRVGRGRLYDPEELVKNLEDVWKGLGRRPGDHTMILHGKFSVGPYRRLWGSLRMACEALARHHAGEITRAQLLSGSGSNSNADPPRLNIRWRVLKRDRYRCVLCGASPATDQGVQLEVDHITPVSRGGTTQEGNLRTLCVPCNKGKSDE